MSWSIGKVVPKEGFEELLIKAVEEGVTDPGQMEQALGAVKSVEGLLVSMRTEDVNVSMSGHVEKESGEGVSSVYISVSEFKSV